MSLINHRAREIHFKIVYYGPSLGGKTTNLQVLHDRLPAEQRGHLLSIATDHERTLFFDFLPFALGQIHGFTTRIHLYTTPGQAYYRLSRRAVLQGADGIVFVADSHPARESANLESLADLNAHLDALKIGPDQRARLGWIVQYNKRDLPHAMPVESMRRALNPGGAPEFEAIASQGQGVAQALRAACKAVIAVATASASAPGGGVPLARMTSPSHAPQRPAVAPSPGTPSPWQRARPTAEPPLIAPEVPRPRARRRASSATGTRRG